MSRRPTKTRRQILPGIPEKAFFRIGEAARLLGVETHVLRFWETEFPALQPQKSPTNQRRYRRADLELLLQIKHLLHDRKYTIAGARKVLGGQKTAGEGLAPGGGSEAQRLVLRRVKQELEGLLAEIARL